MSRVLAILSSVALACGDNLASEGPALAPTAELVVVAHPDDEMLLMQPDLLDTIQRGGGVTSVFVTAGNGASGGYEAAVRRYDGIKSAYGAAAGATDWHCGVISIRGHAAEHCRLPSRNISLVFLGYPDGGKNGEHAASLLHLWQGSIASAETIASQPTRYDRDGLIATLAQILRVTEATTIRTLDAAGSHGRDHSDHLIVGALGVLAIAAANRHPELVAYRGYAIGDEPPNKLTPIFDATFAMLARYEACATGCASCGDACTAIDQQHVTWLLRRYAIGFRRNAGGRLRSGNQCLDDTLQLVSCAAAPVWKLDGAGELRAHDRCIIVDADGALSMQLCLGGTPRRFFVDDEGHIFAGTSPTVDVTATDGFLWCLATTPGGAVLQRCGASSAPTWELVPATAETTRIDLQLTATGRDVRLGDVTGDRKADLCAIESAGLRCATGTGTGTFLAASRIDDPTQPLSIEPKSLVLGDVDGDRRTDACGRDDDGILCATAISGFAAVRWTPMFAAAAARPGTSASLTAVDADADGTADLCGVDQNGVVCAPRGMSLQTVPRSTWPASDAVVFLGDLDADGQTDWCAATDAGPACAVFAHRELSTDGSPWGYSRGGIVDVAPANTATVALADIDGDGRADLCAPREDRIVCARSQGRAFGPRSTTLAILPNQGVASALWLGDLDGDGRADPCVDTGATIVCAVQP